MARNLTAGDLLEAVDPVGLLTDDAWTFGCMVNFDSATSGLTNWFFKIGEQADTDLRGYRFRLDHSGIIEVRGPGLVQGVAIIPLDTWVRLTISHSGSGTATIEIGLAGVQDTAAGMSQAAEITAGDAFQLGRNLSNPASFARVFWLQGTALAPGPANDIFDDLNTAAAVYGSALAILNRIDGTADPEPDWRDPGTNDLDVVGAGTSQVADPLGNPEDGGGSAIPAIRNYYQRHMAA